VEVTHHLKTPVRTEVATLHQEDMLRLVRELLHLQPTMEVTPHLQVLHLLAPHLQVPMVLPTARHPPMELREATVAAAMAPEESTEAVMEMPVATLPRPAGATSVTQARATALLQATSVTQARATALLQESKTTGLLLEKVAGATHQQATADMGATRVAGAMTEEKEIKTTSGTEATRPQNR